MGTDSGERTENRNRRSPQRSSPEDDWSKSEMRRKELLPHSLLPSVDSEYTASLVNLVWDSRFIAYGLSAPPFQMLSYLNLSACGLVNFWMLGNPVDDLSRFGAVHMLNEGLGSGVETELCCRHVSMNSVWGEKMLCRSHRNSLAAQSHLEEFEASQKGAEFRYGKKLQMHIVIIFILNSIAHLRTSRTFQIYNGVTKNKICPTLSLKNRKKFIRNNVNFTEDLFYDVKY
ncbi:hypothetical protein llap_7111 [Limosa lapponica baueri]|uniref:Uncharacterized protein n=1 Tax=Limosa lapponica baueri TaxID=1758121 RepID=A0A2I0U954_LIMLA|nr:hypothetical protein llap_7111 [Limosa lapponica baueri]